MSFFHKYGILTWIQNMSCILLFCLVCFKHLKAHSHSGDFPVQVSDKPKGIAVGAAKECVCTYCHVFLTFRKPLESKE